jgi:hypothetical protein
MCTRRVALARKYRILDISAVVSSALMTRKIGVTVDAMTRIAITMQFVVLISMNLFRRLQLTVMIVVKLHGLIANVRMKASAMDLPMDSSVTGIAPRKHSNRFMFLFSRYVMETNNVQPVRMRGTVMIPTTLPTRVFITLEEETHKFRYSTTQGVLLSRERKAQNFIHIARNTKIKQTALIYTEWAGIARLIAL